MDINTTNQAENDLLTLLKSNTTTNNVKLSLLPNPSQTEVKNEAVNVCEVDIDGLKKRFEAISKSFFEAVFNEFDLKSPKNINAWRKRFERR